MANLNRVLLIGRLTRDPEVRYTTSGMQVAALGLAVNRFRKGADGNRQEETVFVDLTAFGRTAELAGQYLKKGRQVFVEGQLQLDQWEDKNTGQKRSKLQVIVDNLQFLDAKGEGGPEGGAGEYGDYGAGAGGGAGGSGGRGYAPPQRQTGGGGDQEYGGGRGSSGDEPPF